MPLGGLVSLAVLLPNILWLFFPPASIPVAQASPKRPIIRLLEIMEGVGRIGAFAIPFLCSITMQGTFEQLGLIVMLIALAFYYVGWVRYFRGGRQLRCAVPASAGRANPHGAESGQLFSRRVRRASIMAAVDGCRRVGYRPPHFELARISTVDAAHN